MGITPALPNFVRVAGLAYLAIIALGAFGEMFVRASLIVSGDSAATASNIAGATSLWRAAVVGDLLMHVLDVPLIVFFYYLLRPINPALAVISTTFNIVQTCVLVANKLTLVVPLIIVTGTAGAATTQSAALIGLAVSLHGYGFGIGLIFFGISCIIRGLLIYRSAVLPRFLGVLLGLAGASYIVNSIALIAVPSVASLLFPWILVPAFIGELALALWLLVKGINRDGWAQLNRNDSQR
jgi:hypothetical protein